MKKQAENVFTEGLVQDLHPLTVPNNVLTDALNATLITMNGNEFVLQNDMGNGRVEKAYLPPGYVPVGIKEFGGVIYVASYNPLTNKGQIGSFPSPERNIDQEELNTTTTKVTWSDFYDSAKKECHTFISKVELFGGKIMRSGDKFTIYFDETTSSNLNNTLKLLSNYNNSEIVKATSGQSGLYVEGGKAISPKKNVISIYLTVLDSNNNLRDITSQLKRFEEGSNKPLKFDASILPIVKENTGYFIEKLSTSPTDINSSFIEERQKRAVNTYNNKLFGKIYLMVQLNIIDHIDVSVYGFKKQEDGWQLSNSQKQQIAGSNFDAAVGDNDVLLIFDTDYVYNCPDGFTDGATVENPVPGCSGYQGNYSESMIKGLEMSSSDSTYIPSKAAVDFPTPANSEETPNYNQINDLYSLKQTSFLPLKLNENNPVFNYKITPWMKYSPLNGLAVDGSINLSKLGSGENILSTWKYYCDNTQVRLTWGFDSYPVYGTRVSNVTLHFYDILYGTEEIGSIEVEPRASYNGTFTLNILYGDLITQNALYLVLVSYKIASDSGELVDDSTKYAGARWLLTNGVFNKAYLTNSDYSVQDYNNFVGDTKATDANYSDNEYPLSSPQHYRYEFQSSLQDLVRIDLSNSWNQSTIKHTIESDSDSGFLYKEGNTPYGTKYLSKKNKTVLDSSLMLTLKDSIENSFPFELNSSGIKHTFELSSSNKGSLMHDSLNIIGNVDSLKTQAGSDIFTPDDDSEYGTGVVSNPQGGANNWLSLNLSSSGDVATLDMNAGVHSQIAGAPIDAAISLQNCYMQFLSDDTFESVFRYSKRDVPGNALGFQIYVDDGGKGHDGNHRFYIYAGTSNGGNYSFGEPIATLVDHHGHADQWWQMADYMDQISELIDSKLGAPLIAFMCANPNNPTRSTLVQNNSDVGSYALMFWRGVDGKYYIVDAYKKNSTGICNNLVNDFKNIYIYKNGSSVSKQIYQIDPNSSSLVYMNDFQADVSANISVKWERNNAVANILSVKTSRANYLSTLFTNASSVINNKVGLESLWKNPGSSETKKNFDRFVSGVWFVVKTNDEQIKSYSDSITVKGTLEDYNTLLSLQDPISDVLLGSDGTIHAVDTDKVALNPSTIYWYNGTKLYGVTSSKADSTYKKLADCFIVTSYKSQSQLLIGSVPPTKDLGISSKKWYDDDDADTQLFFKGMPTLQLGTSILSGLTSI